MNESLGFRRKELTESALIRLIAMLEETLAKGEGTLNTANTLADYRRQLERIRAVKSGRAWQ